MRRTRTKKDRSERRTNAKRGLRGNGRRGKRQAAVRLPAFLGRFFWESDFSRLRWEQHRDYIIARVLESGSWQAVAWIRKQLGDQSLREWLIQQKARGLSRRQIRFWGVVLNLDTRLVNAWLGDPSRAVWDNRCLPRNSA